MSSPLIRPYAPERDQEAAHRIWRETQWIQSEKEAEMMNHFLSGGRVLVADIDDSAECLVASSPAVLRYIKEDLPLSIVAAVTTSRIARKRGLAKRLTAELVAQEALDGALVSALGMFEQGFYDQLGFGSGSYENWISFDPASLTIRVPFRIPTRLTADDWSLLHSAMVNRLKNHGACTLTEESHLRAELGWTDQGFGLGYTDDASGKLTHFFWCESKGEHGPYEIKFLAYQNRDQFLEIMALVKALGDQVRLVKMREPAGIQIQDLLEQPFRSWHVTQKSPFAHQNNASAYWQVRICDLAGCIERTHLSGRPLRFNLLLNDPIANILPATHDWRGISGAYVVSLGSPSNVEEGKDSRLPTLKCSVGAFTRMWLGVRPASGLHITDDLDAPPSLLQQLDEILCLPIPKPGWDF